MLQSNDRWPLWEDKFESDDADDETKANEDQGEHRPVKSKSLTTENGKINTPKPSRGELLRYANLGTELFSAVIAGMLLGWGISWLIARFTGYRPTWIIAVGVFVGALAGFLNMYRFIIEEEQKEEQKRRGSSR